MPRVARLTKVADPTPQLRGIKNRSSPTSARTAAPPARCSSARRHEGTRCPRSSGPYLGFNDATGAKSPARRSVHLHRGPPLFFLLNGYAVLDNATVPIVGTPEKANDTYVEQLEASAAAAIDKAVEMGVTDRERVGVGGHSYGAFMTANLLAHTDLFRAGIARSGAYNRTLTPFGFQSERRILWEAPETYIKVSPFMVADKVKEPLLLIDGEADNNTGTFPIQSERCSGHPRHGRTVRLVMLPLESQATRRASPRALLSEMLDWFDRHVRRPAARARARGREQGETRRSRGLTAPERLTAKARGARGGVANFSARTTRSFFGVSC